MSEPIVKYLFKSPDGDWEYRSIERYSKHFNEYIEQTWCESDHIYLSKHYRDEKHKLKRRHLTVIFDDIGVLDYHLGLVKYNLSVIGRGELFGNVAVFSQDETGEDIDITEEDLEYLKSRIFIAKEKYANIKFFEKIWGADWINNRIKIYQHDGLISMNVKYEKGEIVSDVA